MRRRPEEDFGVVQLTPCLAAAILPAVLAFAGCGASPPEARVVRQGAIEKPRFTFVYEDLDHPLLNLLRARERLDEVTAAGTSELDVFVNLRQWARRQWSEPRCETDPEPFPHALVILDRIRSGSLPGGLCSEYAAVFLQACLAMGHQARLVSLEAGSGAGHRSVEVWSNDLDKWVLMDPYLDSHFEREGAPLSAMELHRALAEGSTDAVRAVPGPAGERLPLQQALALFRHVTVIMRNNHLSDADPIINRYSLAIEDEITDGRPDISRRRSRSPADLSWRLNQTALEVRGRSPLRGELTIEARTNAPGFARFEARAGPGDAWRPVPATFRWPPSRGESSLEVRAVNLRGVAGPPAALALTWRPSLPGWLAAVAARALG